MLNSGVFFDEWRRCLQEHYLHVIRTQDVETEPTLRQVMLENHFTEDQLEELKMVGICQDEQGVEHPDCQALYRQAVGDEWVEAPLPEPLPLKQEGLFSLETSEKPSSPQKTKKQKNKIPIIESPIQLDLF